MTSDDLAAMLAEQTPACSAAREALLAGAAFVVWDGLVAADQLAHTYRTRLRLTQKRGQPTLALVETVAILKERGDEPLRIGRIDKADGSWTFMLFFNATGTTVLACTGVAPGETG